MKTRYQGPTAAAKTGKTTPILRWAGGKTRLLKHILHRIPEHTCYVEPFAGGLAVLLAKPRSKVEIVNDLNGELVNLYRVVQYHTPELLRELNHYIPSRQGLKDAMAQPGLTDIQRAAKFYYRNRISFGGGMNSYGVSKLAGGAVGFNTARNHDLLANARARLSGVSVENLPYERCLALYDAPTTFFFLDPPYLHAQVKAYDGWAETDLQTFRTHVNRLKGLWMITLDDSDFNRALFADCHIQAVTTACGASNRRTAPGKRFGELVITPR